MTNKEIKDYIKEHPALLAKSQKINPDKSLTDPERNLTEWANIAVSGAAVAAIRYVLINFGLPWLNGFKKWHELQVAKFYDKIDKESKKLGLNTHEVTEAGEAIYNELTNISESNEKAVWEKLNNNLKQDEK